ncbi:MAG: hypothetical protein IJP78_13180 [Clostridia bacterium]|nr:hypothetical protein [Clostridia bacterium]
MRKHDFSQMDEMQREKLLKINGNGMKLCALGLLAAILIQWFLNGDFSCIMGELAVYGLLTMYIVIFYMYEGLWGERIRPSWRGNLLISGIVSAVIGVILMVRKAAGPEFTMGVPDILLRMAIGFLACFVALTVLLFMYRKRRQALDSGEE